MEELILALLEWLDARPRRYGEAMDAWRTSCPRLDVWEEALARGYIEFGDDAAGRRVVRLAPAGRRALARREAIPGPRALHSAV